MKIAVCYNQVPPKLRRGETTDRVSEEGAAEEAQAVRQALVELGHAAHPIPLGGDVGQFVASLRTAAPDLIFNLCEGFWGDSGKELHVAALFELLGVPYTGSAPLCLGLTQDKALTKDILSRHQLPTPPYRIIPVGETLTFDLDLTYPLIVKPRAEDASLGVTAESVVADRTALARRVLYVHATYQQDALVEEYIAGREFNAAILGTTPATPLPLSEIVFQPGLPQAIVSYDGKWLTQSEEYRQTVPVCPALLTASLSDKIRQVALKAYQILGCRDYARVDIRLRDITPYILEINANPDISPDAGLARAAAAAGLPFPRLIEQILNFTLQRKELPHAATAIV